VAVFGTGAVGGYFGARLAQAGEAVVFIARGRQLDAVRQGGLHLESIGGDFHVKPAQATDQPGEAGPVDLVLVTVKAWQVPEAAAAMGPLLGPGSAVLPLVNGVEAYDQLCERVGREHVLGGLCRILVFQVEPGRIRHAALEPLLAFGEWDGRDSDRVRRLRGAFERTTGVNVVVPGNIQTAVWEKLVFIAPMGAVGCLTRSPAGVFRALPETRALLEGMMHEVVAVASARGVPMQDGIVERTLGVVDALPPGGSSSAQRDYVEGRPSELDSQCGAVVRLAARAGVDVPLSRVAYHSLLPLERKARGELTFPS